jgi:putative alpha-1,2-mannosidase
MVGSPLYSSISIRLQSGKVFRVEAVNNSSENVYIQSATLNGNPLDIPVITWEQIQAGGTLRFVMGPQTSKWGSSWRPALIQPD